MFGFQFLVFDDECLVLTVSDSGMGFRAQGFGFRVQGLGFGFVFRVWDFKRSGFGGWFRVQSLSGSRLCVAFLEPHPRVQCLVLNV